MSLDSKISEHQYPSYSPYIQYSCICDNKIYTVWKRCFRERMFLFFSWRSSAVIWTPATCYRFTDQFISTLHSAPLVLYARLMNFLLCRCLNSNRDCQQTSTHFLVHVVVWLSLYFVSWCPAPGFLLYDQQKDIPDLIRFSFFTNV